MPLVPRRPPRNYTHLPKGRAPGSQTRRAGSPTSHRPWARLITWASMGWGATWSMAGISGGNTLGKIAVGIVGMAGGMGVRYAAMRGQQATTPAHYALTVAAGELKRGQHVEVTLRITDPANLGQTLRVGLLCTESYDVRVRSDKQTRRVTRREDVVELWQEANPGAPEQKFTFATPADGPFSYEGDCLSFAWRVIAREHAEDRIDTFQELPLWVTP